MFTMSTFVICTLVLRHKKSCSYHKTHNSSNYFTSGVLLGWGEGQNTWRKWSGPNGFGAHSIWPILIVLFMGEQSQHCGNCKSLYNSFPPTTYNTTYLVVTHNDHIQHIQNANGMNVGNLREWNKKYIKIKTNIRCKGKMRELITRQCQT